jgi:geranylgeranyl pyrophosphate synthase
VIDDILDVTQTSEALGKTAAKDLASNKTTYPKLLGIEKSREVGWVGWAGRAGGQGGAAGRLARSWAAQRRR